MRPMEEVKNVSVRAVNCRTCWAEGECKVEITFNELGRVTEAKVLELSPGWVYRPHGQAGGQAPICPACQSKPT
jgi:hypothetical protein